MQTRVQVLQMMPPNIQEQVIERVGAMETTPMDQIEVVANTLGNRMGKKGQSPRVKTGGVKSAAELLNWFDKEEGKELLKSIEKRNPKLGGSIRQRMFRFEDLVRLSAGDISKITKEVDMDDLVIAMKNASAELKKTIYSTMSKRAVEALEEQLGFLGPKDFLKLKQLRIELSKLFVNSKRMRKLSLIPVRTLSYSKSIEFPIQPKGFQVISVSFTASIEEKEQANSSSLEQGKIKPVPSAKEKPNCVKNMHRGKKTCFPRFKIRSKN